MLSYGHDDGLQGIEMVAQAGESSDNLAKIIVDPTVFSDEMQSAFDAKKLSFVVFESSDQLNQLLTDGTANTVLGTPQFLKSFLSAVSPNLLEQTLVLSTQSSADADALNDDDLLSQIDAFVPENPLLIAHQVLCMMTMHHDRSSLTHRLHELDMTLDAQKRHNTKIDLLKNAIVRNVSHELRTPLLQVKSAVALIGEDAEDKKLINYAQNAVSRLETHIKNITMLGHSMDISLSTILLREVVEYAKRNLARVWTRRTDVERLQLNIEEGLPPIWADKQGLSIVMQLLMDNALKFGKDNKVEVIGKRNGEKIYVAVKDYGIGIADDKIPQIFDSFYQVDDTSTRPYGGAGVGLALVKFILESHQIKIHVESTPKRGSIFWFEIDAVKLGSDD